MMEQLEGCRACGAPCRIETFDSECVKATLWVCSADAFFGGFCDHKIAYLTKEAWNTRSPDARNDAFEEAAKRLEREWPGPAANIVRALIKDQANAG